MKSPRVAGALLWVGAPAASVIVLGLVLELAFAVVLPRYVVRAQAGVGAIVLTAGLLVGGLGLGVWCARLAWRLAAQRAAARERTHQADSHRRFIRRLDHELKNPLTAITVGLANLAEVTPDGAARSLDNVRRQVDRLGGLAAGLRKLAELDSHPVERAPVDISGLIEEAAEIARAAPSADGRQVVANVQRLPWPPPPVLGDRDLLLLALYNLVDNALKFSQPGATVEIRARDDGQLAVMEVADTGVAISPDDLPHVTEELYRGQTPVGVEGSGLGLALVDRVAGLHGGTLVIVSRVAQGTVASLRLPALQSRRPTPRG